MFITRQTAPIRSSPRGLPAGTMFPRRSLARASAWCTPRPRGPDSCFSPRRAATMRP